MLSEKMVPVFLGILVLIAIGAVLSIAQTVIIPLVLAILISFIVSPIIRSMERIKIPRIIAIIVVMILFFGLFYLFGLLIYASAKSFIVRLPRYQERFVVLINMVTAEMQERFPVQFDSIERINWAQAVQSYLLAFSNSLMGFLRNLFVISFFMIFLLLEKRYFKYKLAYAFDKDVYARFSSILSHLNQQIARYLSAKFLISIITGLAVWFCLFIIGLDFPIIWGTLAFLLNFIPNIGSTIIIFLTILMSFIQFFPHWGSIVAVIVSMSLVQLTFGNFIDPKLQGRRLDLSPFLILVSLIFWGWLWGIIGMFLSVPLTVIIRIICENVPYLKPAATMMSAGKVAAAKIRAAEEAQGLPPPPD